MVAGNQTVQIAALKDHQMMLVFWTKLHSTEFLDLRYEEGNSVNGVRRGGYSWVDANGFVQRTEYVVDPILGFQVCSFCSLNHEFFLNFPRR